MFDKLSRWISDAFIQWLTIDRPYEGIPLCDFDRIRYEVRSGDVLLIEGRSRVSDIIRSITQSSWSHAALYIGRLHDVESPKVRNLLKLYWKGSADTQLVIEGIMGEGTVVRSITSYRKDHIRLCRPKGLSRQDAQLVIAYAIRKLGTQYDARHIFDLARFLLPWGIVPGRFRSKLFEHYVGESTRTVCSSMIAEAFGSVEFPILPLIKQRADHGLELITRNPKLYTPRDFDYSPYFYIIKYPFVEFADYAMYRKLPWNREGLVSHDQVGVKTHTLKEKETKKTKTPELTLSTEHKESAFKRLKERLGKRKTTIDPEEATFISSKSRVKSLEPDTDENAETSVFEEDPLENREATYFEDEEALDAESESDYDPTLEHPDLLDENPWNTQNENPPEKPPASHKGKS